jgi:hypothetical protein
MFTVSTLGCAALFIIEEQSEPYIEYGERAPQIKNVLSAKRTIRVTGSAGKQDSSAEEL